MKWHLSASAYHELQRSENASLRPGFDLIGNPTFGQWMGTQIFESHLFPYQSTCAQCHGSGDGGETSTWCLSCQGTGGATIDGLGIDHRNKTYLLAKPLPRRFAISFPTKISVPAAPMRGRIKEVRL